MGGKRRRELKRQIRRHGRRFVAEFRRLRLVWMEFRYSLLFTAVVWTLAVVIMHEAYPVGPGEEQMSWTRAAYYVLMMTAFEAALDFHVAAPWPVKAIYFALPLLGLFVIIDAIVRFTGLLFRSRENTQEWQDMLASTYSKHVIVCGLGHVGTRIVQQLVRSGTDVVAIEQQENDFLAEVRALGVPVIIGDVRRTDTLEKAQVKRAESIICATDLDMVNIECGLNARELAPSIKVVLRLFDQGLAKKIEKSFLIDAAYSTSALAAPVFAAAAVTRNVINSFVVEGHVLNTVELTVRKTSRLQGRTIDSLREEFEVTFLMYQEAGHVDWNPRPDQKLVEGAKVLIVTTLESLREIEALNAEPRRFSSPLG